MSASDGLVLYLRQGCHLCEQFLVEFSLDFPARFASLRTADVDADPGLALDYGLRVPVLAVGGTVVCEGLYDRGKVEAALGL
ncbi:MAG TPA: glutaredoxin family protein [Steroidobacteraceae bacterium]|nr:glutaredoxin family protein [Steroidobacteraceae bacterium]